MAAENSSSVKIIVGSITGSQDSTQDFSFSKELADFHNSLFPGITGSNAVQRQILDIAYVPRGNNHLMAVITITGSLPA